MNARSIRRQQERKARKLTHKEQRTATNVTQQSVITPATTEVQDQTTELPRYTAAPVSTAQLHANPENSKMSDNSVTPEGNARASRNALKTGLTGRTILLPGDAAALYDRHVNTTLDAHHPQGDQEIALVQSIADTQWRLARIPSLESGIYALGRLQFAEQFRNFAPAEAAILIEANTFLAYQKQLNNLSIQESRLRRQSEKDLARLAELQKTRTAAAPATLAQNNAIPATLKSPNLPSHKNQPNGFEFQIPPLTPRPARECRSLNPCSSPRRPENAKKDGLPNSAASASMNNECSFIFSEDRAASSGSPRTPPVPICPLPMDLGPQ